MLRRSEEAQGILTARLLKNLCFVVSGPAEDLRVGEHAGFRKTEQLACLVGSRKDSASARQAGLLVWV